MSLGIYFHIPFCLKKCPYCDFYSIPFNQIFADEYFNALLKATDFYGDKKTSVNTIYFGGGTPNLLAAEKIGKIIKNVYNNFNVDTNCEITMEANPESLCSQNIEEFSKGGINRLSLGLQSANQIELDILKRTHTLNQVEKCISDAKSSGINNISLDLMLALGGQKFSDVKNSIDFCVSQNVNHISAYMLKIEKNTAFYNIQNTLNLPDDDLSADIYSYACSELENAGYNQYEISNFSKPGFESRHNLKYWNCQEYIGIGASAHGFLNGKRYFYPRDITSFISNPNKTVFESIGGSAQEEFMLKLRLNSGINIKDFEKKHILIFSNEFYKKINLLQNAGYVNFDTFYVLSLTKKGFLVSNTIISDLLEYIK